MKRYIILLFGLLSITAYAQHQPLKQIDIPDDPIYQMDYDNRNNLAETINYYSASAHIATIAIVHAKGIAYPDMNVNRWDIRIILNEKQKEDFIAITQAEEVFSGYWTSHIRLVLSIGEAQYHINSWSLTENCLFIEVHKDVIRHMGISGFQSISAFPGDTLIVQYQDITQELWRRCAKNVYEGRKNL